ncbi:MAG: ACT domain-containing protein [Candidatus Obscuribacterales bacterium]|nr:ACT domain-containing protein [Candidatus Obscuribacterales bacterium]
MLVKQEQKIIRILRLKVTDKPGYLGKVATLLGDAGANIGEISIISQGPDFIIREISLQLDSEEHLRNVQKALASLEGVEINSILDPVQQVHEGGKIIMRSRVPLKTLGDMRRIYTPGVAQICRLIEKDITLSRKYTGIGNSVAVVTNGTAILGLGNIGAVAGMPVMEGKSVLFNELVGISAVPILVEDTTVAGVVDVVKSIASTFGAIQLEDIAAPECFEIEEELQKSLPIPVLHDDQHGTAVVVLAALINIAVKTRIKLSEATIGIIGLGAAGTGIAKLLKAYGVRSIIGYDIREEAMARLEINGGKRNDLAGLMENSDIVVATTGRPGLINPNLIRVGQVILALSNPDPEIHPDTALSMGASFAADGRTINNALAFPGLFHGALKANASRFTDRMLTAAATAIAAQASGDLLVPSILDHHVHQAVSEAVEKAWFS